MPSFFRIEMRDRSPQSRRLPFTAQYARARARGHPRSAMPDRKLVPSFFRIEMRDRSPQSRPAGWPAAGLQVMPRLDHGPRDRDEAVLAEMRAVLDKMAAIHRLPFTAQYARARARPSPVSDA